MTDLDIVDSPSVGSSDAKLSKGSILESKTFQDGRIYLYKRADYKKPTWLCRIKVPKGIGYVTRSTKTGNEHEAYKFASSLYEELLVKSLTGNVPSGKRIGPAIRSYLKRLEPDRARRSIHYKMLLMKRLTPFLERQSFGDVSTAMISRIIDYLIGETKKGSLSPNTIKRIHSDLKQFLRWCVDEGHLAEMPRFPKTNSKPSQRPHFDAKDWKRLTRYLTEYVKIDNRAVRRDRMMLRDYVLILANTGIRVGEARTLKWRDLSLISADDNKGQNVVLNVMGKTGKREVVASSSDVKKYFQRIYQLRLEEMTTETEPEPKVDTDSLIFCHKDGSEIGTFKKAFRTLIKEAGVERNSHGEMRTIYSLRHTYATFRLQHNVSPYALAKNMGTSVAMLEQFYGHTTNRNSAAELTKRTKREASGAGSPLSWLKEPVDSNEK